MAGDEKGKVPDEALAGVDWKEVYVRLTAFAHARLRGTSIEDARRLARILDAADQAEQLQVPRPQIYEAPERAPERRRARRL